jgi:hypothetical protein
MRSAQLPQVRRCISHLCDDPVLRRHLPADMCHLGVKSPRPGVTITPTCMAGVENPLDIERRPIGHKGGREDQQRGEYKATTGWYSGAVVPQISHTLLSREGVGRQTMEAGLLTDGSSYSPTPSQWMTHQWLP